MADHAVPDPGRGLEPAGVLRGGLGRVHARGLAQNAEAQGPCVEHAVVQRPYGLDVLLAVHPGEEGGALSHSLVMSHCDGFSIDWQSWSLR